MKIQSVIHTNQHSIDRVLGAGLPVVLLFWSPATPTPAPVESALERFAETEAGKLLIAKVNAQAEQSLMARFGVRQTPALAFFKAGRREGLLEGSLALGEIQAWINYLAAGGKPPAQPHVQPTDPHSGSMPLTLTDATFSQVVNGPLPVLVDFWAPWCGPCRMVAPSVEQLAREFAGKAVVAKLNVDEQPRTAQQLGIQGIPALLIFQRGQVVDRVVGAQPFQVLQERLARFAR